MINNKSKITTFISTIVILFIASSQKIMAATNPFCTFNDNPKGGINTALGCVPTGDLNDFASWIVKNLVFVASGIAFLLMAFGAFQIITSSGDPKKTQAGSELITSALSGLLFIILSIFLLRVIGVDILKIPGLS